MSILSSVMLNKRKSITWTNDGSVHWRIYVYASICLNELSVLFRRWNLYWFNTKRLFLIWTTFQYPIRRLIVRSREVSKPRGWQFKLSYRFEIWQAHRQHCCRSTCQISERSYNSKYKSSGFETYNKTYLILKQAPGLNVWSKIQVHREICIQCICANNSWFLILCVWMILTTLSSNTKGSTWVK